VKRNPLRKQGPWTAPSGPPYGMERGEAFAPPLASVLITQRKDWSCCSCRYGSPCAQPHSISHRQSQRAGTFRGRCGLSQPSRRAPSEAKSSASDLGSTGTEPLPFFPFP